MTPEEQQKMKREAKIERLRWLQKQYRMLENGATKNEKTHLRAGGLILEGRIERIEFGGR